MQVKKQRKRHDAGLVTNQFSNKNYSSTCINIFKDLKLASWDNQNAQEHPVDYLNNMLSYLYRNSHNKRQDGLVTTLSL